MLGLILDAQKMWDEVLVNADSRVKDWFMMSSLVPTLVICLLYFGAVLIGPTFMEKRKPLNIKNILVLYNLAMVALSTYLFMEFLLSGWANGYSLRCQPVDFSNSKTAIRMANACWWFYISKFIELLDTIFFIMRKKYNQVTYLHVFHHGVMPFSWWFGVKFVPGGFGTFHAMINSFIHLVMYTYYGLAALGPRYQKYLWWKKYMTKLQLAQFVICLAHASQLLYMECNYPTVFVYWILLNAGSFLILFANFYYQSYISHKSKPQRNGTVRNGAVRNGIKSKTG